MHGDTYLGEITEPISRKFIFFSLSFGSLLVNIISGPVLRIKRERVLRGDKYELFSRILTKSCGGGEGGGL